MGRPYKLFATGATGSANALASLRVVKNARVRCIQFAHNGQAGAALDGQMLFEVSKQNTSSILVNDTPETVISTFATGMGVNAGAFVSNASVICDVPVSVGDTLYLNSFRTGTAPVASNVTVTLFTD